MRLIDADEMLKRLEEWNTDDGMDRALYNFALHRIIEQPTVTPEPQWIPCNERLPEDEENEYLVTILDRDDDVCEVYKGFYQDGKWWTQWCHGCLELEKEPCGDNIVIAWMPLPALPKPYREERR